MSWQSEQNYSQSNHFHEVILVSKSPKLIEDLQTIIHAVIQNVEDLPLYSDIKAAVLDTEYARLGSELEPSSYLFQSM
jgi:hypothetical protein